MNRDRSRSGWRGIPTTCLAGTQRVHIPAVHDRSSSALSCAQIPVLSPLSGVTMQCQRWAQRPSQGGGVGERVGAVAWSARTGLVRATHRSGFEVLERVGAATRSPRDSSMACLTDADLVRSLNLGAADGTRAMTTPRRHLDGHRRRGPQAAWRGQRTRGQQRRVHARVSTDRCSSHHGPDAASAIWDSLRATRSSAPSRLCW